MLRIGRLPSLACLMAITLAGVLSGTLGPAQAGRIHWKEDPRAPGCYALAFDDTDQWFATPAGLAFKKGVCLGQRIKYKVELAPDGESFTASGAHSCVYRIGEGHLVSVTCGLNSSR